MKHTQGEWQLSHSPTTKSKLSLRWYKSIKNKKTIGGKILSNAFGDTKEEAEANAKLIAAAPVLYQWLITGKVNFNGLLYIKGENDSSFSEAIKKATE